MTSLVQLRRALRPHLSGGTLVRLVDEEFSRARKWFAQRHLDRCASCRARYEQFASAAVSVERHRQVILSRLGPLSPSRRTLFLQQLDLVLESPRRKPWWIEPLARLGIRPFGRYEPSLRTAVAVGFAVIVLLTLWHWRLPAVSASDFLSRAVASDRMPGKVAVSGVIRRQFRIQTAQKTILRSIYLDAQGHRQPRPVEIGPQDADLAARLALAGVSWDDPLSAVSFKSWHDSQESPTDEVHSSGTGLLTIRTRLQSSFVVNESLTVRESSFHPVERVIEYRDFGTINISEVSLDLLAWDKTDELFFNPLRGAHAPGRPSPVRELPLSAGQINQAELQARLILNQKDADSGEQIEISRDDKGVHVRGLVESPERKSELSEALDGVPFLTVAIQSFDDLKSAPEPGVGAVPIQQRSSVAVVSPLEQYFLQHGRSRDDLSRISAGLFNLSLAINRSSRLIDEITSRFSANSGLTPVAIEARDQLLSRTTAQLGDALSEQQRLLDEADMTPDHAALASSGPGEEGVSLVDIAVRNVALTQELVAGPSRSDRSGQAIAAELAQTIMQLRSRADQFSAVP